MSRFKGADAAYPQLRGLLNNELHPLSFRQRLQEKEVKGGLQRLPHLLEDEDVRLVILELNDPPPECLARGIGDGDDLSLIGLPLAKSGEEFSLQGNLPPHREPRRKGDQLRAVTVSSHPGRYYILL